MGGIYAIRNKLSDKRYVGSTKDFKSRKKQHFSNLRCNRHHNKRLQRSFSMYGEDNFEFVVLEDVIDIRDLSSREDHWIIHLDSLNHAKGYNCLADTKCPSRGFKWSEESKKRVRESGIKKGSKHPNSKINEDTVRRIFALSNSGLNQRQIHEVIGIDHTNVSLILSGKAWSHVGLAKHRSVSANNKSGCTVVYFVKNQNKWKAEIIRSGSYHGLGYYEKKEEAIVARKNAEVYFGV